MSNAVLDFQVNGRNRSSVGGVGNNNIKLFPRTLGGSIAGGLAATPSLTNPSGALWLPVGQFDGQTFKVTAAGNTGNDSGDPSGTVDIEIYAVTGTLANPVYTAIAGTAAITPTYASAEPFFVEATLVGDSVSGLLTGGYWGAYGFTLIGSGNPFQVIKAIIGGLDFQAGNPALMRGAVLGFAVGCTFGTSNASNTASLYEFNIS